MVQTWAAGRRPLPDPGDSKVLSLAAARKAAAAKRRRRKPTASSGEPKSRAIGVRRVGVVEKPQGGGGKGTGAILHPARNKRNLRSSIKTGNIVETNKKDEEKVVTGASSKSKHVPNGKEPSTETPEGLKKPRIRSMSDDSLMCHQCQWNDKGRVVPCGCCRRK